MTIAREVGRATRATRGRWGKCALRSVRLARNFDNRRERLALFMGG